MRRENDFTELFIQHFRSICGNRIERIGVQNQRPRVRTQQLGKVYIQFFTYPRAHSRSNTVRTENVPVDRLKLTKNNCGELSDCIGKQRFRNTQLGIARSGFETSTCSEECRAAESPARQNTCRTITPLMRIGAALREEVCDVLLFPDFCATLFGINANISNCDLSTIVHTVRHDESLFHLPHGDRLIGTHTYFRRNATLLKPARKIARNNISAAAVDEIHEHFILPVDRTGKPCPEEAIHNHAISSARNTSEHFTLIFVAHGGTIGRELFSKAQNAHVLAVFRENARGDKSVAAIVTAPAHEEDIRCTLLFHCLRNSIGKRLSRALHELRRRRARTDGRGIRTTHLFIGKCIFHS